MDDHSKVFSTPGMGPDDPRTSVHHSQHHDVIKEKSEDEHNNNNRKDEEVFQAPNMDSNDADRPGEIVLDDDLKEHELKVSGNGHSNPSTDDVANATSMVISQGEGDQSGHRNSSSNSANGPEAKKKKSWFRALQTRKSNGVVIHPHPLSFEGLGSLNMEEMETNDTGIKFNIAHHWKQQRHLHPRALLVGLIVFGITYCFTLIQGEIEEALVGYRTFDSLGTADEKKSPEMMKGIDMVLMTIWGTLFSRLGNVTSTNLFLGKRKALILLFILIPLAIGSFIGLVHFFHVVVNDRKYYVTPIQTWTITNIAHVFPNLVLMTQKYGFSRKWFKRAVKWSLEPLMTSMIGGSCAFYTALNEWSESYSVWINVLLMSCGWPFFQFAFRTVFVRFITSILSSQKSAENALDMNPLALSLEIIFQLPGLLVIFHTNSEAVFYNAITLSLFVETVELYPLLKMGKLKPFQKNGENAGQSLVNAKIGEGFGAYIANLEQAEKIALMVTIMITMFITEEVSTKMIFRAIYTIFLETIVDVLKEMICERHGAPVHAGSVKMSVSTVLLYVSFSLCGVGISLLSMQILKYLTVL